MVLGFAAFLMSCQTTNEPLSFSGQTIAYYGGGHGVQVEYYAPSGRSHLWYPGNPRSVPGWWKTENDGNTICFRYASSVYNPVSNRYLGDWDCKSADRNRLGVQFTCSGDPFRLASGKIPFALDKGRGQLRQLKENCS